MLLDGWHKLKKFSSSTLVQLSLSFVSNPDSLGQLSFMKLILDLFRFIFKCLL